LGDKSGIKLITKIDLTIVYISGALIIGNIKKIVETTSDYQFLTISLVVDSDSLCCFVKLLLTGASIVMIIL
jgi:hypothetical protein